jgi:BirA family transcriptional regulator, biotin operon repressor / biotin---[acetyl-CoA-carboxylase] ligase
MNEHSAFDRGLFESLAVGRSLELGRDLIILSVTTSTNDVALGAISDGAPHGLLVVADHQTQGRGRRGKTWMSARPGENLLFSVLLRLKSTANHTFSNITLAIGLALRDALQPRLDDDVRLKWANDLMVRNRKLGGILVEGQVRNEEQCLAVGIGINVHMPEPPEGLNSIATSLYMLGARDTSRELILADILERITERVGAWQIGGFACMACEFRACDALAGRHVSVDGLEGRAMGIDDSGALLLQVGNEPQPRRLLNGTVTPLEL